MPKGLVAITGGSPAGTRAEGDNECFEFESPGPTWRIDIAAARFSVRQDPSGQYAAYVLPGHEEGATNVLRAMRDAADLYSEMFGPASHVGYTAIEVPEGWGSQASDYYILQTAAAFENPDRISEVYHEIAHGWNPKPAPEVQGCRYFDEAFASYLEALAKRRYQGNEAFEKDMADSRERFLRWVAEDPGYATTPIAEYGEHEMGELSYSKGALSLYVLHRLLGDPAFFALVKRLRAESAAQGINFEDFQRIAEQVSGRDLAAFFQDWLYGTESSRLLSEKLSIERILSRY